MARDYEPPVRERDEPAARRGKRRDEVEQDEWGERPQAQRGRRDGPRVRERSGIEEMPDRPRRFGRGAARVSADDRSGLDEKSERERAREAAERRARSEGARADGSRPDRSRAASRSRDSQALPAENGRGERSSDRARGDASRTARARDGAVERPARGERTPRSEQRGQKSEQRGAKAARNGKPERGVQDRNGSRSGRNAQRPTKTDYTADRAMGTPVMDKAALRAKAKADRRKHSGPPLLDERTRAKLEMVAREQTGLRAAFAQFRIRTDDIRRRNYAARAEQVFEDGFDRSTAQLTDRGYAGEGGGRMNVVGRPVEYRATTAQVAGLWPWSVGAGAPLIGTPLGSHLHTGAPVCFDPMNWFLRGSFITAPSLFVLGLNGFGKSSLVRRIVLGGIAQGITPLILADVKPDYRKMVELVGGQVIDLGYGHGKLNPLAAGVLGAVVPRLEHLPALQLQVLQDLRARQVTLIAGLVELVRGARVRDYEETLISTALRILYQPGSGYTPDQPPIMENLLEVIVAGGEELMLDAGADDPTEYQNAIKGLRRSLRALTQGPFGAIFNGQTSVPIDTGAVAVCIDVSHIPTGDKKLKAAVMLACWADGFASVEAAHVLADADMGPQRYFQVVMDELWQVLGLGDFMVDRVDELTRLQRSIATALIMISHTVKDLQALGSEAAIAKALGFLERARAKIFGALPAEEVKRLDSIVPFTSAEEQMVTGWSAPQALTGEALKPGQLRPSPPGTGKFLLKIGEDRRPGIPFHMEFTLSEKESGIHDTNQRFSEFTESTARGTDSPSGSAA
ncbi:hypothetical protein [Nocardia brasiliensis]|uniref:hypothetical protein n=1 Tax=Nocardia brasiliensis TaxID=37326 RepID=UPI00366E4961